MRGGVAVAACASVPAALLDHVLDTQGWLPFVHEAEGVRNAMGPLAVVAWLVATALLIGFAAATRPLVFGAPAALLSAGVPELLGRHDLGAVFEPGAMMGALVQWLLLLAIIGLAVAATRVLTTQPLRPWSAPPLTPVAPPRTGRLVTRSTSWSRRPRSPPYPSLP